MIGGKREGEQIVLKIFFHDEIQQLHLHKILAGSNLNQLVLGNLFISFINYLSQK